ncbi:MAG: uracil-DNA glycosylase [Kiritimatiellia bacterium]|jgi:uracil-DNA glycosylase family 4
MRIPKDIYGDLRRHLEVEMQAGRRFAPLDPAAAAAFLAIPTGGAPARTPAVAAQAPAAAPAVAKDSLQAIAAQIAQCTACGLHQSRTNAVPGVGNANAPDVMFIGEGPGYDEDVQGVPFVGRAGRLLTKMVEAMGYSRNDVFIANIVKCRPPGNRTPDQSEMVACMPYLLRQIALVKPKTIVALGGTALKGLTDNPAASITRARGMWDTFNGIPMMPTFHPAYLLRFPTAKAEAWRDLKAVLKRLGKTPPRGGGGSG